MEVTQIFQKIFPEDAKAAQISDIVVFKMKIVDIIDHLL